MECSFQCGKSSNEEGAFFHDDPVKTMWRQLSVIGGVWVVTVGLIDEVIVKLRMQRCFHLRQVLGEKM